MQLFRYTRSHICSPTKLNDFEMQVPSLEKLQACLTFVPHAVVTNCSMWSVDNALHVWVL